MRILEGVRCALTTVFEDIVLGFKLRRVEEASVER